MSTVTVTRTINAEPARVWRVLTDLTTRSDWLSTVDDLRPVTSGAFGAGTAWLETHTAPGGIVTEEFRVTECLPPRRFVVHSPGTGADYRLTYTLVPVEVGRHQGGTIVTIEQEGHPSGATGRVLELVLGGLAVRTAEGALRQELDDLADAVARLAPGAEPAA